jgi:4'-phosphopantetheinyl transferase
MPHLAEGFEVVLARLTATEREIQELRACLSETEHKRAARFRFEHLRRRFIVARARLRQVLGAQLGVAPRALELAQGADGKPRLAGGELHFSVSHCDEVALIGISPVTIGVDIEALRPVAEADAIAEQVFSPRERDRYAMLAPLDRPLAFLRCWTRKEALVKAVGGGLAAARARADTELAPGWWLHTFFPLRGFIAAVACYRG